MTRDEIKKIIECLLFVSSKPISKNKFAKVLEGTDPGEIEELILEIGADYNKAEKPIFVQHVAGGWRYATKPEYAEWVKLLFSKETTYRLSIAALETLAIISYRQPVTVQEIELIRGVSAGGVLRGLLEKRLIKIAGRKEVLGRPILYRTSDKFLEYFGLTSISDLPPLEDLGIDEELKELIEESGFSPKDNSITEESPGEKETENKAIDGNVIELEELEDEENT
ncbi:SMC-Scp complex subunit ScpB [Elusimicrobiota bacterium]